MTSKLFLTGDFHIGRSYRREAPAIAERFARARVEALRKTVRMANEEACGLFLIAGDLYDRVSGIPMAIHEEVANILGEFTGDLVGILPGNHDSFPLGDPAQDTLWRDFQRVAASNTRVFLRQEPFPVGDVILYPCVCHARHSAEHALGWLAGFPARDPSKLHIGLAHGAVEGYSPDPERLYYRMTVPELLACRMDAWLMGHTHTAFSVENIFNAGTPQQTDFADHATGKAYLLEVSKGCGPSEPVSIHLCEKETNVLDFVEKRVFLEPNMSFEEALTFPELDPARTALRVFLAGRAAPDAFRQRSDRLERIGQAYIQFDVRDDALRAAVTPEDIDRAVVAHTPLHRLLHAYAAAGDPESLELLDLAFGLLEDEEWDRAASGKKRKK